MKKVVSTLIAVQLALTTPVGAVEYSQQQWLSMYQKQVELTVQNYYVFLGKNYLDAAFLLSQELQFGGMAAARTVVQLQEVLRKVRGRGAERAQGMRELLLLRSQAVHLAQELERQKAEWEGLKYLHSHQCTAEQIDAFSKDFSISATVGVRELLAAMKAQLDEVMEKMGPEVSIQFSVSIPLGSTSASEHVQQSRPEITPQPFWKTYEETVENSPGWSDRLSPLDYAIWTNISLPERRFIPLENANKLGEAPLLYIGVGPGDSNSDMKPFMGAFGLLGAGAGSYLGPPGMAAGSVIGAFVGGLLGQLFGAETVVAKWKRIIHTQADFIMNAVAQLEKTGSKTMVARSCQTFVSSDKMNAFYSQIEGSMAKATEQIQGSLAAFDSEYERVSQEYREELETLVSEVYPVFLSSIDRAFESYFAEVEKRSQESRDYVAKQVAPSLGKILKSRSRKVKWEAQDKLWDALIDGQARFSPPVTKGKDNDLIYWQPAYKTILRKLSEEKP